MNLPLRYFALALTLLVSLHYLASYTSDSYSTAASSSLARLRTQWPTSHPNALSQQHQMSDVAHSPLRPNAAFVILCRNEELSKMLMSLQTLESTFNSKPANRYPYVFLNDAEFSERFKRRIRAAIPADVKVDFGRVQGEAWGMPDWINRTKAEASWAKSAKARMPYGGSESYRNMCRFNSGYFFRHELLKPYRWYWRVEPDVRFLCDLEDFDPFRFMRDTGKKYGFTIALHEIPSTVRTLWVEVRRWLERNQHRIPEQSAIEFVTDPKRRGYNMCHFWSNFEIADLDFFRSEAYLSFFDHLDKAGGFYYERWGDAPVHSIAASLLLNKDELHHFDNIGYLHSTASSCPKDPVEKQGRCWCTHETSLMYDDSRWSCKYQWDKMLGKDPDEERAKFNTPYP